jgi:biopolymer transport protein TolR
MGASLGTSKKTRNVDLNIVPFIDLMSCLTAFLLVTAAWVDTAALDVRPKGISRESNCKLDPEQCEVITMSILVGHDAVWLGVSRVAEIEKIPHAGATPDWAQVAARLREHKASTLFADSEVAEVAVDSTPSHPLRYQSMVTAMELATAAGFADVGITDPAGLTTPPR